MGWIHRWARIGALAPRLVNFINGAPGLAAISKRIAGFAPQRSIPRFAQQTFRQWFGARKQAASGGTRVLLWPDTFNNHFHPDTAIAATRVLEAYGCTVVIPKIHLCCGRALYDFGMLEQAKKQLAQIMRHLQDEIEAGTPIIGLEPACVSVFKDELPNLFPDDPTARRLAAQVVYFSDFLKGRPAPAAVNADMQALVHGHCHHKAVIGMAGEMDLLQRLGVQARPVDSGCCGMAGSIGFRPESYELSVKAAELDLLPAIRRAQAQELIVASGFSCREQVDQLSPRKAVHVADAAAMALGLQRPE
jgi:Fe-S oxidoreductase